MLSLQLAMLTMAAGECLREGGACRQMGQGSTFLQFKTRMRQTLHSSSGCQGEDDILCKSEESDGACAPFAEWPNVDRGVTCGGCRALVLTAPYGGRCDTYCASFGHTCIAAAEEKAETCEEDAPKACNEVIAGTSDMLCTCQRQDGNVASTSRASTGSFTLRAVSYNLYWWNAFDQNSWKSDSIIRNIRDNLRADTLGLQECDSPSLIRDRTGLEQASKFSAAQGVMMKPGLFTTGETGSRDLQATGKWGARYVTWVQLTHQQSGRTFWHFNTHWCVASGNGRVCNEEVRYVGAKNMLATIQEKAGNDPVVVTGDFNANMNEKGPRHFQTNGLKLAVSEWVDAIFYSHHWQVRATGRGDAANSDHRPVFAELELL
mmetsp:Transcript_30345/g.56893  ORF Transcript_30345/g.56893 Transcript_30345/m.56893 type:complete len:376 (+) Transcript_30345:51-1178(+)